MIWRQPWLAPVGVLGLCLIGMGLILLAVDIELTGCPAWMAAL